jgi:hypothetical protein
MPNDEKSPKVEAERMTKAEGFGYRSPFAISGFGFF